MSMDFLIEEDWLLKYLDIDGECEEMQVVVVAIYPSRQRDTGGVFKV